MLDQFLWSLGRKLQLNSMVLKNVVVVCQACVNIHLLEFYKLYSDHDY